MANKKKYRLIIQHLLFHTKQVTGNGKNAGTIQLQPQDYALDEVVVKAERPFVKVENGRLGYNLVVLSEKQVVNNAYEALMRLPGVQESKGGIDSGRCRKSDCNPKWKTDHNGCRAA